MAKPVNETDNWENDLVSLFPEVTVSHNDGTSVIETGTTDESRVDEIIAWLQDNDVSVDMSAPGAFGHNIYTL